MIVKAGAVAFNQFTFTSSSRASCARGFMQRSVPLWEAKIGNRNIDVTAQSEVRFDEACRTVVAEAAKTLRGIMSFLISEAECVVEHDGIIAYRQTVGPMFNLSVVTTCPACVVMIESRQRPGFASSRM
jgi:flavin-binding protein dodecin